MTKKFAETWKLFQYKREETINIQPDGEENFLKDDAYSSPIFRYNRQNAENIV